MKRIRLFFVVSMLVVASLFVAPKVVDAGPLWPIIAELCLVCVEGWICIVKWCEKDDESGAYTKGGCQSIRKDYCFWECRRCEIVSKGMGPLDVEHYCGSY